MILNSILFIVNKRKFRILDERRVKHTMSNDKLRHNEAQDLKISFSTFDGSLRREY